MFGLFMVVDPIVTLLRKYWSVGFLTGHGMFLVLGTWVAFAAFGADRTMGNYDMLIHPLFQSTLG